jgi:hypothetical protein
MDWDPPDTCGNGHRMAYPNILVGWAPCDCEKAGAHRPTGHQYVRCRTCSWQWRDDGCDKLVDGYER